jgi:ankyrin repeat protein
MGIQQLAAQLCAQPTNHPISYLLERWATPIFSASQILLAHEQQVYAENFRKALLHTATRMQFSRVVEVLLIAGAEVDAYMHGKTPLIVAAENGDQATARVLLNRGAHIHAVGDNKQMALHLAASNGHNHMVQLLVDQGVDIEAKDNTRQSVLHAAAGSGHKATVRMLVEALGADKEVKDNTGQTALHTAARSGHESMVRMLVQTLGADKEAKDNTGQTALHAAAGRGHKATVRMLVEALGADKDAKDNTGQTALHAAAGRQGGKRQHWTDGATYGSWKRPRTHGSNAR